MTGSWVASILPYSNISPSFLEASKYPPILVPSLYQMVQKYTQNGPNIPTYLHNLRTQPPFIRDKNCMTNGVERITQWNEYLDISGERYSKHAPKGVILITVLSSGSGERTLLLIRGNFMIGLFEWCPLEVFYWKQTDLLIRFLTMDTSCPDPSEAVLTTLPSYMHNIHTGWAHSMLLF